MNVYFMRLRPKKKVGVLLLWNGRFTLFARLLKSRDKYGVLELAKKGQVIKTPTDSMKDPYILDFLGLSDFKEIHESKLEAVIIDNIQSFLLELGKGVAFVA